MELEEFSDWKLLDLDWHILEGLEEVLHVSLSHLLNPWTGTHVTTDSSHMSTKHVVRIHTGFVACDLQFWDVDDRVGKTRWRTRIALALDRNWPAVGKEILHANGWYRCICYHNVLVFELIFVALTLTSDLTGQSSILLCASHGSKMNGKISIFGLRKIPFWIS